MKVVVGLVVMMFSRFGEVVVVISVVLLFLWNLLQKWG